MSPCALQIINSTTLENCFENKNTLLGLSKHNCGMKIYLLNKEGDTIMAVNVQTFQELIQAKEANSWLHCILFFPYCL